MARSEQTAGGDRPFDTSGFGDTNRTDNWWSHPLAVFVGLSLFVVYGLARTLYPIFVPGAPGISHGALLSPFYSPLLFSIDPNHHAVFGTFPANWPTILRSPAILILWAPLGLRLTCYYYRKAYYRAFFQDPTACAVSEPRDDYEGETGLLIFQNLHRYFLYLGLVFIVVLSYDTVRALFWLPEGAAAGTPFWQGSFEIHVGTLILATNVFLLAGYTLGCHSLRYLAGGKLRCFSCPHNPRNQAGSNSGAGAGSTPDAAGSQGGAGSQGKSLSFRYTLWRAVTKLNVNHSTWAWFSLFMVAFADFYVWMVSIGVWTDYTIVAF